MCNCGNCSKKTMLCPISFGLAWGITMGLFMAIIAWSAWMWGYGISVVEQMSVFYNGYDASLIGGGWGALWGLIEGFIMGFFIAFFYDCIIKCCKGKCSGCNCGANCTCGPNCNCGPNCKCCKR